MARLPYVDPERAPERVREALAAVPPLNVFRMVANAETAFRPWLAFGGALLSALELDARLRELVILHVGRLSGASDDSLAALREHLSTREVVELLLVIGQYRMVARVAETAGIEIDEGGTAVLESAGRL